MKGISGRSLLVLVEAFHHSAADRKKAVDLKAGKVAVDVPVFKPGERVGRIYEAIRPNSGRLPEGSGAIALKPGPHLFLDDYLVESTRKVTRKPITLKRDPRIPNPVINGARDNGDRNCQPFLNCLRDPKTGRFRFWYSTSLPGYTVVAWTRDGETWLRERVPLLDRHHSPEAWDHAMAWVDVQLPVGDDVFLYYGGNKNGHKSNPTKERQVGLVKMKRDRYVAREAGAEPGRLETPLVTLEASRMTVNVEPTAKGEVRVQVVDAEGKPFEGFRFDDCQAVTANAVAAPVQWKRPLSDLKGKPVRLQFSLKLTRLYAFDLE